MAYNNPENICTGDFVTNHYHHYNEVIYKVESIDNYNVAKIVPAINPDGTLVTKPTRWRRASIGTSYLKRHTVESITARYEKTIESIKTIQGI